MESIGKRSAKVVARARILAENQSNLRNVDRIIERSTNKTTGVVRYLIYRPMTQTRVWTSIDMLNPKMIAKWEETTQAAKRSEPFPAHYFN